MRILDALDFAAARTTMAGRPAEGFPDVSLGYIGSPWPAPPEAFDFVQAAQKVATVKAITDRIAHEIGSIPPTFYRRQRNGKRVKIEREKSLGNIADLVARGNNQQSGYEVLRDLQLSEDVNGNGYLFADRMGTKLVQELWSLHGHLMTAVAGPRRTVDHYEWGTSRSLHIDPAEIIALRYTNVGFDPMEPAPVGLSPLAAAIKQYETRYGEFEWLRMFYKRGGRMDLILSVRKDFAAGVRDAEVKKFQQDADRRFNGPQNQGLPAIFAGVDVVQTGMKLAEMAFLETAGLCDADLCRVYGTIPEVFGFQVLKGASAMEPKAAALHHDMVCLVPRWTLRDEVFNERLCPMFGDDIECATDYWSRPALAEYRLEQAKSVVILTGEQPVMSPNRGRELIGEEPSDDPEADRIHWKKDPVPGIALDPAAPGEGKGEKPVGPRERSPERDRAVQPVAARLRAAAGAWTWEQRRKAAEADLRIYERRMERFALSLLGEWKARAIARLEREQVTRGDVQLKAALDPSQFELVPDDADRERLQRIFEQMILERGESAAAQIGTEITLDVQAAEIALWIRDKASFLLQNASETTIADVRAAMAEGAEAQETFAQIVGRVRDYFDDQSPSRAALIARTETTGAYNFAALQAYRAAGIRNKRWITIGDDAVRESHVACEAEGPIPIDQAFSNGLQYAGEPGAPADEVCNCRCIVEAEFEESISLESFFRGAPSKNGHAKNRLEAFFANGAAA